MSCCGFLCVFVRFCGFLWVLVSCCGFLWVFFGRLNAPLEPIRTYQNPVCDNALPLKSAGRVRVCEFLWGRVSSCGFCGRQNAPLEPIRTYQNPVRDTPAPQRALPVMYPLRRLAQGILFTLLNFLPNNLHFIFFLRNFA